MGRSVCGDSIATVLRTGQVAGLRPDLLRDLLQVEQRPPARWAADVLGLRVAHPRALRGTFVCGY